jgi:hypothetical protein
MNQLEQMAQMFAAIDAESRRYVMVVLRSEYERAQEARPRRPVLRLIQGGPPAASTTKPRASVRTKKKEST